MTKPFLMVRDDGVVLGVSHEADPDDGPIIPQLEHEPDVRLIRFDGNFTREGRRDSEVPHLIDGAIVWVETASAAMSLPDVIAAIDAAADAARRAAIGDPARALEYQRAEMQARAYAAAGYTGAVPRCVKAWADPKGWTGQQAADDIITTADAWLEALDTIRDQRLAAKEAARAIAADPEGQAGAVHAVKNTFLTNLKTLMASIA